MGDRKSNVPPTPSVNDLLPVCGFCTTDDLLLCADVDGDDMESFLN